MHSPIGPFERVLALSDEERQALWALPMRVALLKTDQEVVREGDRPSRCFLMLEGFACTFKMTSGGRRQILGLHVPGDLPDLESMHLETLDHSIGTITPCRVGFIYHEHLRDLCRDHPRLQGALWRMTLVGASIAREWMVSLGRREARMRLAHLFCELLVRLDAVGLARDHACELPLTQGELGDLLGLSTVHVNRTVRDLRRAELISLREGQLKVLNWEGLRRAGEFKANYLHLERQEP
jgi:CRP-like cAMP-binding protein